MSFPRKRESISGSPIRSGMTAKTAERNFLSAVFLFAKMVIAEYNAGMAEIDNGAPKPIRSDVSTEPLSEVEKIAAFVRTLDGITAASQELLITGDKEGFRGELVAVIEDSGLSGPNQLLVAEMLHEIWDIFLSPEDSSPHYMPVEGPRRLRIVPKEEE